MLFYSNSIGENIFNGSQELSTIYPHITKQKLFSGGFMDCSLSMLE